MSRCFYRHIDQSLSICVMFCSSYFSAMATQEILDELRPKICPVDWNFGDTMKMLKLFLPVKLPPDLHNQ